MMGPEATIHDVIRGLVRGYPNHESYVRDMLLTVDGHEKGFATLGDYRAELEAQAAALAPPPPPDARDAQIAAQAVEIAQLRAEAAQRAASYTPPAASAATEVTSGPAPRL